MNYRRFLLAVVFVTLLSSCGMLESRNIDKAARSEAHTWAVQNDYPYEIIESDVEVGNGLAVARYAVAIDNAVGGFSVNAYPSLMYLVYQFERYGEEWRPELVTERPLFDVTLMNYSGSGRCDDMNNRSSTSSPCFVVQNTSVFDWKFKGYGITFPSINGGITMKGGMNKLEIGANETVEVYESYWRGSWDEMEVYLQLDTRDPDLAIVRVRIP